MDFRILQGIVYNIALLLSLGLVYDTLVLGDRNGNRTLMAFVNGLVLSVIVAAVMLTPVRFAPGIVFDTRSILLAAAGLLFGWIPSLFAILTAGVLRIIAGGAGVYMGTAVIVLSGVIGIVWRRLRRDRLGLLGTGELFLFSMTVHIVMTVCIVLLPGQSAESVLRRMGLIILFFYPAGMTLLLLLMQRRYRRARLEEQVRENERLLKEYFDNAPDAIFVVDMNGRHVDVNHAAESISGYTRDEILGKTMFDLIHPEDHAKLERRFAGVFSEGRVITTLRSVRKDGAVRTWRISASRLSARRVLGFMRDITDRLKVQEDLRDSLEEKSLLLRELYHRTKNNMQVISSMLQLQAVVHDTPEVRSVVRDVSSRIRTIALVHQKLYQSGELSGLGLREYVDDLFMLMMESFVVPSGSVLIEKHVADLEVLMDVAVPLGLVINELFTNSIRHAFPGKEGKIRLDIDRDPSGMIVFEYRDNGPGLEEGFDPMGTASMGLKTVVNIGKHQLGGNVIFDGEEGFRCRMTFHEQIYNRRV